jgi:hypothetical protein
MIVCKAGAKGAIYNGSKDRHLFDECLFGIGSPVFTKRYFLLTNTFTH